MNSFPKFPSWTDDTFWIVRAAGERTKTACHQLIAEIVPPERLLVIEERPFTRAIKHTLEAGADSGQTWTVVIDADVLIDPRGWQQLLEDARRQPEDVYCVQGMTADKFIPIFRPVGIGMYRSKLMPLGLSGIPTVGKSLRPESTVVEHIFSQGYRRYRTPHKLGIHDHYQGNADILRKTFLHRAKHANVAEEMKAYWENHRDADIDFRLALLGAHEYEQSDQNVEVDRNFLRERFEEILLREGIPGKPTFEPGSDLPQIVRDHLDHFEPNRFIQQKKFPTFDRFTYGGYQKSSLLRRVKRKLRKLIVR